MLLAFTEKIYPVTKKEPAQLTSATKGLPAHDMVFIFFTFLSGVFKSSVFISFKKNNLHL